MGNKVTRTDFEWTDQEEPHAKRRMEILKKYPQIKKLFGVDPTFKWKVFFLVVVQIFMMFVMKGQSWPVTILTAYFFGGVINHALMLAVHEIAHSAGFGYEKPMANRILGMFANLPIGLPFSVAFKGYHLEHHRYQGKDVVDTDIPTELEAKLFCTTFGKFIWVCLQPFFYTFRPLITNPKQPIKLEYLNTAIQLAFDAVVIYYFGGRVFFYLIGGSIMAMGFHPVAGHFISEHYMFNEGFETYSYYGPLNWVTFNVGYHNEHHDFPYIPGSRLPEVRKIAPEYYDMPSHNSWTKVIYDFIFDPAIGPYARIKRKEVKNVDHEAKSLAQGPKTE
uniref:sphingolipid 4-desaturase n=1 Tax=Tigriopus japonicus TaxID=158387 RepID=A0A3S5WKN6_TIGJA|nr:delta4-desaturase [Tigriopus japonicus]